MPLPQPDTIGLRKLEHILFRKLVGKLLIVETEGDTSDDVERLVGSIVDVLDKVEMAKVQWVEHSRIDQNAILHASHRPEP